ncbi:AI-2E family transporter [Thalassotalea agarivorans]|nr:AI-2E family transporter [Thalassotalea agarivorans]
MLKGVLILASIFVIFAGIQAASNMLVPLLLSIFIAIICQPLVNLAARYKMPKFIAITAVVAIFVAIALSLAALVGRSLTELSKQLPVYRSQLNEQFSWVINKLAEYDIQFTSLLSEYVDPAAALGLATDMLSGLGGVMANLFLIILTVVFILFEADSFPKKLHIALDDPSMREKQIDKFLHSVNNYLAIKTLVSIATGLLVTVMLWAFGLDFYLLWGVLAFLLNYIPNIGSIIAAVPAMSLAVLQLGPGAAGAIGLGYLGINTIMGNIVEPKFLGKGLGLSTLVVFLSLVFWGWMLGSVGMLLSVPLTMVIKIGLENSEDGRWLAVLLSGEDIEEESSAN